jgi:3-hydroxybutyryl-CoA dehydrogenase
MKLVELIPALQTSPEVLARARAFAEAMGKTVTVSQDAPGESMLDASRLRRGAD